MPNLRKMRRRPDSDQTYGYAKTSLLAAEVFSRAVKERRGLEGRGGEGREMNGELSMNCGGSLCTFLAGVKRRLGKRGLKNGLEGKGYEQKKHTHLNAGAHLWYRVFE